MDFSNWLNDKESAYNTGDSGSISGLESSPGRGNGNPLQFSLPGKFHGQRSLADCSPQSHKELDMTEQLSTHTHSLYGRCAFLFEDTQSFLFKNTDYATLLS